MILAIRTDKPIAELHLVDMDGRTVHTHEWQADRQLADTLLKTMLDFLKRHDVSPEQLDGIAVFTGKGSFTGLRIGTTVANAFAYSLNKKVVAVQGEDWLSHCAKKIQTATIGEYAMPKYDGEPNITKPKA
ncbi:tRNA (adenosine(37)-N6)-threonylcarbamoyltransferase complex dimerization subunit type 1 TsaB [bacterium]|nr:tRNA (adenosine(37)-N6)-threonylcarbamoyltransferase complex dimerization subunit type 1 TsaB [bacterium]